MINIASVREPLNDCTSSRSSGGGGGGRKREREREVRERKGNDTARQTGVRAKISSGVRTRRIGFAKWRG